MRHFSRDDGNHYIELSQEDIRVAVQTYLNLCSNGSIVDTFAEIEAEDWTTFQWIDTVGALIVRLKTGGENGNI